MTREEIQNLLLEVAEEGNFNAVEYWEDALRRMVENNSEIWLS